MDPNINPETGETMASGRSPRFSMWVALTVFSVIVLGASVEVVRFGRVVCFDGSMCHNQMLFQMYDRIRFN